MRESVPLQACDFAILFFTVLYLPAPILTLDARKLERGKFKRRMSNQIAKIKASIELNRWVELGSITPPIP